MVQAFLSRDKIYGGRGCWGMLLRVRTTLRRMVGAWFHSSGLAVEVGLDHAQPLVRAMAVNRFFTFWVTKPVSVGWKINFLDPVDEGLYLSISGVIRYWNCNVVKP